MIAKSSSLQGIVTFKNTQGEAARGTILRLSRSTVVFEVYNPYSIVQLSEVLTQLTIRRGDRPIYSGRAVVSNLVNTGLMLIVSVTLVDGWSDLTGLLSPGSGIGSEVRRFIADYDSVSALGAEYKLVVGQLRSFLSELSRWLEQVDLDAHASPGDPLALSTDLFFELAEPLYPRLADLFSDFEEQARQVPDESLSYHKAYAQRDLHPLLLRAPFIHRTFSKPLGYAGDYEMVNMMLRNGREGPNTYAQVLHSFYVRAAVCEAHRNRIEILARRLSEIAVSVGPEHVPRVLSVGCGPAQEVLRYLQSPHQGGRCDIELLDFSAETLQTTREAIDAAVPEGERHARIHFVHDSVHDLLKRAASHDSQEARRYDFIYCAGLFDYLSDRVCSRLVRLFLSWVKRGGLVLVTNVHPSNGYRGAMEHLLEWHLIYRDERDMLALAPPNSQTTIYADATGVNVFLEVRVADRAP